MMNGSRPLHTELEQIRQELASAQEMIRQWPDRGAWQLRLLDARSRVVADVEVASELLQEIKRLEDEWQVAARARQAPNVESGAS